MPTEKSVPRERDGESTAPALISQIFLDGRGFMVHRETEFDGQRAKIASSHAHGGKIAICQGADKTAAGWAMKFKEEGSGLEFYVFNGKDVNWLEF